MGQQISIPADRSLLTREDARELLEVMDEVLGTIERRVPKADEECLKAIEKVFVPAVILRDRLEAFLLSPNADRLAISVEDAKIAGATIDCAERLPKGVSTGAVLGTTVGLAVVLALVM